MVLLCLVDLCCGSLLKGPKRLWRLGQGCHPGTAGSPPAPRARAHSTPSWMKSPALRACSIPPAWIAGLPEVMNILALDNNALNGSLPASWDLPASVSWLYLHNNSFGGASGALVSKQLVLAARGAEPAKCRPLWCGVSAHRAPKMLRCLQSARGLLQHPPGAFSTHCRDPAHLERQPGLSDRQARQPGVVWPCVCALPAPVGDLRALCERLGAAARRQPARLQRPGGLPVSWP